MSYRVTPIKTYHEKIVNRYGQYIELALDKPLHHIPEQTD